MSKGFPSISKYFFLAMILVIVNSASIGASTFIADNVTLEFASPEDGFTDVYSDNKSYSFITEWNLTGNLTGLEIEHNFSGEVVNEDVTNIIKNIGYFTLENISAGVYSWKMGFEHENSSMLYTPEYSFTINKSNPNIEYSVNATEVYENEYVNLYGRLLDDYGTIELLVNNDFIYSGDVINYSTRLDVGLNNVSITYPETKNYLYREINSQVLVDEIPLLLEITSDELDLGDSGIFRVTTLQGVNISTTIFGPGCNTELWVLSQNTDEDTSSIPTNLTGTYCVNTTLSYGNISKTKSLIYEVLNTLDIRFDGETAITPGSTTSITAEARGGFEPYTYLWVDSEGWDISSGAKLEEKYSEKGVYSIDLIVEDSLGNTKTFPIELEVFNKYKLKTIVKDKVSGSAIRNAKIKVDGEYIYTNDNGVAEINLFEGSKSLKIDHPEYLSQTKSLELSANENVEINLDKKSEATASFVTNSKILIIAPTPDETYSNNRIKFEAEINPTSLSICKFYLSEEGNVWYEELYSFSASTNNVFEYTEELDSGDYTWRVECSEKDSVYSSNEVAFTVEGSSTVSSLDASLDLGSIRASLESARDGLDSLSFEDQKSASALDLLELIRDAIRDFDRNVRDINSIKYRTDLTDDEIDANLDKYANNIENIESETPRSIKTIDSKQFIDYPDADTAKKIAEEYITERQIEGSVNSKQLHDLQGKIDVRTQVLLAEVEYLSGEEKDITIISKTIGFKNSEVNNSFFLEKIPSTFNLGSKEITFIQGAELIKKNSLYLFEDVGSITYYFDGHIELSDSINTKTILLSDLIFSDSVNGNFLSGFVTNVQFDLGTPFWSIFVLVVLLATYVIHSFDLFGSLANLISGKKIKNQIHKLNILINDSQDYLDAGDLDKANLIFKELKFNFEKSHEKARTETYDSAIKLHDNIDLFFLQTLIKKITEDIPTNTKSSVIAKYNMLIRNYQMLPKEIQLSIEKEMQELQNKLSQNYPEISAK